MFLYTKLHWGTRMVLVLNTEQIHRLHMSQPNPLKNLGLGCQHTRYRHPHIDMVIGRIF